MGSAWYYVLAVSLYRMFERPWVISGAGIAWGYLRAGLERRPRLDDPAFRRHLRRAELCSLLLGKRRALRRWDAALRRRATSPRVLAAASGGGHWVQLLRVMGAFEHARIDFLTVSRDYRAAAGQHGFHVVNDATRWSKLAAALQALRILLVILKVRPDVVVTTGAAPGYFALRLGKWLGARTIWIDSIANVEELSMAGRLVEPYADLWLTQWPHLARQGRPEFAGAVL
jgi:hypothetical protein